MRFERLGNNMVKTEMGNGSGWYYITMHENPKVDWPDSVVQYEIDPLIMCSCPDFTIGRAKNLTNPFRYPCKHVDEFLKWEGFETMCTAEDILKDIKERSN